jgi:hypothetical protein
VPQDYAALKLDQQVTLIKGELPVIDALTGKKQMWAKAKTEIDEASSSLTTALGQVEPVWTDRKGDQFAVKNRNAIRNLDLWSRNIQTADPMKALDELGVTITQTATTVINNYNAAQEEISRIVAATPAAAEAQKAAIELAYQQKNATALIALDTAYDQTGAKLTAAAAGADWEQAPKAGPGGAPTGGAPGDADQAQQSGGEQTGVQPGSEQAGGEQPGGEQPGGQQAGGADAAGAAGADAGGAAAGGAGGDPSLSGGLGAAPTLPPPTFTPSPLPPPMPGGPGGLGGLGAGPGMLPLLPSAARGLTVGGGGGGGGGFGAGGGGRLPGVGVSAGGGTNTIPTAAVPVSGPSVPTPAAAPAVPGVVPGGAPGGPGGGMPMMPPMGAGMGAAGMGGGGSGGGPGSGAVRRPGNGRRREGGSTAGMPPVLRGKSGKKDPHTFVSRSRSAESDIPTTVQLIDEDLWQVDAAAGKVVGEQPPQARRVRR